uniref:Uncharacterized protein n=1 Tax=Schistosoma curassoni TaxID=6186 RepID=A0A183KEI3_9TREM
MLLVEELLKLKFKLVSFPFKFVYCKNLRKSIFILEW